MAYEKMNVRHNQRQFLISSIAVVAISIVAEAASAACRC